jgi:hypothetical protein
LNRIQERQLFVWHHANELVAGVFAVNEGPTTVSLLRSGQTNFVWSNFFPPRETGSNKEHGKGLLP